MWVETMASWPSLAKDVRFDVLLKPTTIESSVMS